MKKTKEMICLNLGCGPKSADGWINYDWGILPLFSKISLNKFLVRIGVLDYGYELAWPKIILRDIRKKLPWADDSVNFIYCSHVLEHFERNETKNILKECRRVLGENGILRVVLPDLNMIIKKYENDPEKFNKVYCGYDKELYKGMSGKIKRMFIREHKWMYTPVSFKKILIDEGFHKIEDLRIHEGKTPDLDELDLEIHKDLSFYIEAGN